MTMLLSVLVAIFGCAAFMQLPVSDLPVVDSPVISVSVSYPGASPSLMASAVATPLEKQFMQIPGIRSVISTNTEGSTSIILTFDLSRSVDLAAPDVQAAISSAQANLPTDLPAPPTYTKTNPSDAPIMYLTVTSDSLTPGQLYDYANITIGNRIYMVYGVSQVQVWGSKRAIRIQVDPNKLAAFKLGLNDVAGAIKTGTVTTPGGSLNGKYRTFSIEPAGQLVQAQDYEDLILAYRNNAPVRMKDVAICTESVENDLTEAILAISETKEIQRNAVILAISRVAGSNTVDLAERIKKTIEDLKKELPASVELEIFYDKSTTIVESIDDVKNTILIALALVIIVIFLFLGRLSDTIIPSVTLPLSLLMTFIAMQAMGFSLNNLSLLGIILAIGFVVDDAIVVLENTVRIVEEEGLNPLQAAIKSAQEIGFTIVSMTLSLAIIFVPLVFMGGTIGRVFREFAVTVVVTIFASGIVSLTLTPMMCARMLKGGKEVKETGLQKFMNKFLGGIIAGYDRLLRKILLKPIITLIVWALCLFGTGLFFVILPQSFLPEGDSGVISAAMMGQLGISTKGIQKFQNAITQIVMNDPNVSRVITVSGMNLGADQSTGMFVVRLKEAGKRLPMPQMIKELREKMYMVPFGLTFMEPIPTLKLSVGGESTASGNKYSYVMVSPDMDKLYSAALELERRMRTIPMFVDIQNSVRLNMPELDLELLRDRASTFGLTAGDIENSLLLSYAGGKVTTYKTDIDQYQIIVELEKSFQEDPENLFHIYLRSSLNNSLVPLASISRWTEDVGPQNVPHYNQLSSATISFNIQPGVPLGNATKALQELSAKVLPAECTGFLQGEAEQFQEAMASLGILVLIAIFIKYIVLGILYESYMHPFTILTTLPVATVGGLATLYIFGSELSLYAYVGVFMLLGIVAKNGIMMVDFANQLLEKEKITSYEAICRASVIRFRPILMTGLAAIMGALPIALGYGADGSSRIPLGLIVVGGLIFSQVITLFVTPGLFLYMQRIQEKYLDKFELFRAASSRKNDAE